MFLCVFICSSFYFLHFFFIFSPFFIVKPRVWNVLKNLYSCTSIGIIHKSFLSNVTLRARKRYRTSLRSFEAQCGYFSCNSTYTRRLLFLYLYLYVPSRMNYYVSFYCERKSHYITLWIAPVKAISALRWWNMVLNRAKKKTIYVKKSLDIFTKKKNGNGNGNVVNLCDPYQHGHEMNKFVVIVRRLIYLLTMSVKENYGLCWDMQRKHCEIKAKNFFTISVSRGTKK